VTTTPLPQPPSLAEFLDAGCDPSAIPGLDLKGLAGAFVIRSTGTPRAAPRFRRTVPQRRCPSCRWMGRARARTRAS
jgi:hypothetical protein